MAEHAYNMLLAPTRRTFLTTAGASAIALTTAAEQALARSHPDGLLLKQHAAWSILCSELYAAIDAEEAQDYAAHLTQRRRAIEAEREDLEQQMARTPAASIVGVAIKLQVVDQLYDLRWDTKEDGGRPMHADKEGAFCAAFVADIERLAAAQGFILPSRRV